MKETPRCPRHDTRGVHRLTVRVRIPVEAEVWKEDGAWRVVGLFYTGHITDVQPEIVANATGPDDPVSCRCGWTGTFSDLTPVGEP